MRTVVITGSRHWSDPEPIKVALQGADRLIVGDCPPDRGTQASADAIALSVALRWDIIPVVLAASPDRAAFLRKRGVHVELVSDWTRDGRRAGPLRNSAIATAAREALAMGEVRCHAFPWSGSVGTVDCIRQLRAAGLAVEVHPTRSAATELQR
jgi:hypothetical protein